MTKIEWVKNKDGTQGRTWNPVTGCSKISPGCQNCYAERMSKRLAGRFGYPKDEPFRVTLHPERLEEPLRWRKPQMVFVCSMGDLFHEDVPFEFVEEVRAVMVRCPQHTFQLLTKRSERMLEFARWMADGDHISTAEWPRNVWLGVTAENQEQADKRIPVLLQIPAAVRFVSVEPMLGPIDLYSYLIIGTDQPGSIMRNGLDQVICGGETGPKARPMHPDWARILRDQCQSAGVPFFFKSWGEWMPINPNWFDGDDRLQNAKGNLLHIGSMGQIQMPGNNFSWLKRVGEKATGRLLDGRTWNEMPEVGDTN